MACGEERDSGSDAPPSDAPGLAASLAIIEAVPQRPGDPAIGYDRLINAPYVSCGVPVSLFERVDLDPLLPLVGLPGQAATLPGRSPENAALPYFLTRATTPEGVDVAATNCLSCHAQTFRGELVVGLGNTRLDATVDAAGAAEMLGRLLRDEDERAAYRLWADRITALAPYVTVDTAGLTAADNAAVLLFGRRDPTTLEWRDTFQIPDPGVVEPVPVATPPWWRMAKKNAMFATGSFRGDHARYMFAASSLCMRDARDAEALDAYFHHVRAYIASIEAPRWPWALDSDLARRGETVFEAQCSRCHGTYGEDGRYPNFVVAVSEVGTDRALVDFEHHILALVADWVAASWYGETNWLEETGGYVAPPLDGVWISAPYLHNDSVPTLEALLDSRSRPSFWRRTTESDDDLAFDRTSVGWKYDLLDQGKRSDVSARENARIYDTTRRGYGNQGHTYGDALTSEDRAALIEYLKTL